MQRISYGLSCWKSTDRTCINIYIYDLPGNSQSHKCVVSGAEPVDRPIVPVMLSTSYPNPNPADRPIHFRIAEVHEQQMLRAPIGRQKASEIETILGSLPYATGASLMNFKRKKTGRSLVVDGERSALDGTASTEHCLGSAARAIMRNSCSGLAASGHSRGATKSARTGGVPIGNHNG